MVFVESCLISHTFGIESPFDMKLAKFALLVTLPNNDSSFIALSYKSTIIVFVSLANRREAIMMEVLTKAFPLNHTPLTSFRIYLTSNSSSINLNTGCEYSRESHELGSTIANCPVLLTSIIHRSHDGIDKSANPDISSIALCTLSFSFAVNVLNSSAKKCKLHVMSARENLVSSALPISSLRTYGGLATTKS